MIRPAGYADLPAVEGIYETARLFMRDHGNPHQWYDYGYPERKLLEQDIKNRNLYVIEEDHAVHGVFAFIPGPDPTYRSITDGAWPNELPYGTIHRIAGDGQIHGILKAALRFALETTGQVRADTHRDNLPMQRALEKNGFIRCGIIHLLSGDPRIAYQYSKE